MGFTSTNPDTEISVEEKQANAEAALEEQGVEAPTMEQIEEAMANANVEEG